MAVLEYEAFTFEDLEEQESGIIELRELFPNQCDDLHLIHDRGKFCKSEFFKNLRQKKLSKNILATFLNEFLIGECMETFILDFLPLNSLDDAFELGVLTRLHDDYAPYAHRMFSIKMLHRAMDNAETALTRIVDSIYNTPIFRKNLTQTSEMLELILTRGFVRFETNGYSQEITEPTDGGLKALETEYDRILDLLTNEKLYERHGSARDGGYRYDSAGRQEREVQSFIRGVADIPYRDNAKVIKAIDENKDFDANAKAYLLMWSLFNIKPNSHLQSLEDTYSPYEVIKAILRTEDEIPDRDRRISTNYRMIEASGNANYNLSQFEMYANKREREAFSVITDDLKANTDEEERYEIFERLFRGFKINSRIQILNMLDLSDKIIPEIEYAADKRDYLIFSDLAKSFYCKPEIKNSYPSKEIFTHFAREQLQRNDVDISNDATYEEVKAKIIETGAPFSMITKEMSEDLDVFNYIMRRRLDGKGGRYSVNTQNFDFSKFTVAEIESSLRTIEKINSSNAPSDSFNLKAVGDCYLNPNITRNNVTLLNMSDIFGDNSVKTLSEEDLYYFRHAISHSSLINADNLSERIVTSVIEASLTREIRLDGSTLSMLNTLSNREDFSLEFKAEMMRKYIEKHSLIKECPAYDDRVIEFGLLSRNSELTVEDVYGLLD